MMLEPDLESLFENMYPCTNVCIIDIIMYTLCIAQ